MFAGHRQLAQTTTVLLGGNGDVVQMLGSYARGLGSFKQTTGASPSEGHDIDLQAKVGAILG